LNKSRFNFNNYFWQNNSLLKPMQTKNLIKIIKAESAVLVSLIENLPDDGDIQSFEIEMLQNKIKSLADIAGHLSPENQMVIPQTKNGAEFETSTFKNDLIAEQVQREAEEAKRRAEAEELAKKQAEIAAQEAEAEHQRIESEKLAAQKAAEEERARRLAAEVAQKAKEEAAQRAEAERQLAEAKRIEIERKQAESAKKSLAETLADNTVNVEQTYTEPIEQEPKNQSIADVQPPITLADKFQQHVPSINDVLAGIERKANIASRYNNRPINNLRKAIKINDRMQFINVLFNHDSVQYEQTIDMIENASGIDEVLTNIFSRYQWNQEDETVLELIYQRFKK